MASLCLWHAVLIVSIHSKTQVGELLRFINHTMLYNIDVSPPTPGLCTTCSSLILYCISLFVVTSFTSSCSLLCSDLVMSEEPPSGRVIGAVENRSSAVFSYGFKWIKFIFWYIQCRFCAVHD